MTREKAGNKADRSPTEPPAQSVVVILASLATRGFESDDV
jgi:hypothetical protein